MTSSFGVRLKTILAFVVLLALVLVARLYFVQIVHGDQFSKEAERQYVSVNDSFDRGTVFFERKDGTKVPAASLAGGYVLAINPSQIADPEETYSKLSGYLTIDKEKFLEKANKVDDPYEEIADHLSPEQKRNIEELSLRGVSLYQEYWRFYPGESLAADVLGFVGHSEEGLFGQYGLERQYETILARNEDDVYVNFFAEIFSQVDSVIGSGVSSNKGDLVSSIEPIVQRTLEDVLSEVKSEWSSKMTAGIIMDPKTGFIYGLAEHPSYNPNKFGEVRDIGLYKNELIESVFEMGSIVKALTVAIGLDVGAITPQSTYNDKGAIVLDGRKISNYDGKARGVVNMQEVLNQSLNTGASHIALTAGTSKFADYMEKFGIREITGIDLPNEAKGLTDNLDSPRRVEYATASFGQGIAVSPISMAQALATLGNGGVLMEPHIIKEVNYDLGYSKTVEPKEVRRVISTETSEEITRMLVRVVDEALLGGVVAMDTHSIAAKTGTAQIAAPQGGYYEDRYLHSFFGYFPAYEPRFLIFLMNVEPQGARYASETLTHPFMDLAQFLIQYYEIPPDRGKISFEPNI